MVKSLPEEYQVRCNSQEENNIVMKTMYDKKNYVKFKTFFEYIVVKKHFDRNHLFRSCSSGYPIYSFADWFALINSKNNDLIEIL